MTHGAVLIIEKNHLKELDKAIEDIMSPYWELDLNINDKIRDPRTVWMEDIGETIDNLKKSFDEMLKNEKDKKYFEKWKEEQIEFCHDTDDFTNYVKYNGYIMVDGKLKYGTNVKAKWDWYQIGGRFRGEFKISNKKNTLLGKPGVYGDDINPINDVADSALKANIINIKDIFARAVIVDDDWIEYSEMGWFGSHGEIKNPDIPKKINLTKFDDLKESFIPYRVEYLNKIHDIKKKYYTYDKTNKIYILNQSIPKEGLEEIGKCDFYNWLGWCDSFYDKFIKELPDTARLTIVDYHI
jgi:hypothetical protein